MPRNMSVARCTALIVLLFWIGAGWGGCQRPLRERGRVELAGDARPMPKRTRAVWVARFHYRYPDDIRTIMRNCRALGFDTVLWQVRGNGTVAYPSRIEPWSKEFNHQDPGFDPLALAVEQAHAHGMRIEAWVNVLPGWRGPRPPPIKNQLYYTNADWFLRDADGRRQPLTKFYALLNPCLPEVRRYVCSLIEEIAANYAIDGVHLDYVRYAWELTPGGRDQYPRDARTLALFRRDTKTTPDKNPRRWDAWRAAQLTRLVADIRATLRRVRPRAALTAAVVADSRVAAAEYLQNAVEWLRSGLVDAAMPMAYRKKLSDFERFVGDYRAAAPGRRIIPGVGIYKHNAEQMRAQLRRCAAWGGSYALFSYTSLHATAEDRAKKPDRRTAAERLARREVLRGK